MAVISRGKWGLGGGILSKTEFLVELFYAPTDNICNAAVPTAIRSFEF